MKPIHHALVSARLFGGDPMATLPIHQMFDSSKGAVSDMRHRAALHSVDHGAAVMAMAFPGQIMTGGPLDAQGGVRLYDICEQHVLDDQGQRATLDDWLLACEAPAFVTDASAANSPRQDARLKRAVWRDDPLSACLQTWGGTPEDYSPVLAYYALPEKFSDHPLAPAVSRNAFAIMLSDQIFGPALRVTGKRGKPIFVPTRDIGEEIALAAWGMIPNLADVFRHMRKRDWMMGSKVSRSNERRKRIAGRQDLFDPDMEGIAAANPAAAS